MQRQQKLLLSFMIGGLMLFYGIAVVAALTPQEIYKIAKDSTVHLFLLNAERSVHSTGSGFFVAPNHIATNYHVIEDMLTGEPKLVGGVKLVGKEDIYAIEDIVDFDKENDLAIIKVKEVKGTGIDVPALPLGDSDAVQIGETIYVAGNPQGLEGTFSDGIISAIRGDSTDKVFQMTAPISQGSSGGPVLNDKGEVIGISVATFRDGQNLNFAIPVNYLKQLAKRANIPITSIPVKSLVVPHSIKHAPASEIPIGETIPLTLDLISSKGAQQIRIYYTIYDKDSKELEQYNQEMRLWKPQSTSSRWVYKLDLPSQKRVGSIKYYIEVEYDNQAFRYPRAQSRYYQISIVDDKPPTISVLEPPVGAQFTADQQITVRAEVIDNSVVEEVHIYVLSPNDQNRQLSEEGSSDMYAMDISFSQVGTVEYYLTATDEAGKESRSENRRLTIIPPDTTPPTIRLIKPSRTTFEVDQQIPIEAKVTDGSSVKQVRLFYSFSPSRHFSHYFDRFLTETSSDTYTGHIPPQSKVGYIEYYLTATDEAGNESISEPRQIDIRPPPPPRPVTLDKGIKLYEQAKYNEAIEALQLAIRELEDLEQQAEAYLYLGGAKRGSGASNDEVKEEFRKAIRLNPNQELPVRVGNDHPIFVELLEEVRIELIGDHKRI